jgi:transcriptional regulator with XRE-family HTH domain
MQSDGPLGDLLRAWRRRRRLSQLELAAEAEISAKHLCFIETGRSQPSRQMVLRLAERLDVPLRERNALLEAAGYADLFPERPLADPAFGLVRGALDMILDGHRPFPAFAVDRHWTLIASNGALRPFLGRVDPSLQVPPINVLRLTLHPLGLGPRIANHAEWRRHVLQRVRRQCDATGDARLEELHRELSGYPSPDTGPTGPSLLPDPAFRPFVVPFQLATEAGVLSFFCTTTSFGSPLDVTLAELALECFYPADASTGTTLRAIADRSPAVASLAAL